MSASGAFYFNQPADQWAVTQLLQLTTRDQLHLVLHILGLLSTSNADHRKLSLSRLAVDLGYSRSTLKPLKARMVSAGFLVEHSTPGRTSTYSLGPAVTSSHYQQLVEQFEHLAQAGQLAWPFNANRRQGAASINSSSAQATRLRASEPGRSTRPGQLERPGTWPVRAATPPGQLERPGGGQLERPPIESSRECSLESSLESEPQAEVVPQASTSDPALACGSRQASGYGPAEIPEQLNSQEQPDQQQTDQLVVETAGTCWASEVLVKARERRKVKESQPAERVASVEWWEQLTWPEQEHLHQVLTKVLQGRWLEGASGEQGVFDDGVVECDDGLVSFVGLDSFRNWRVADEDGVMMSVLGDVAKHYHASSLVES